MIIFFLKKILSYRLKFWENILNLNPIISLISTTAKFDLCFLLKIELQKFDIISINDSNNILIDDINAFLKIFVEELNKDLTLFESHEAFNSFLLTTKLKQYYIKNILTINSDEFWFWGFSRKAFKNNKTLNNIRENFDLVLANSVRLELNNIELAEEVEQNKDFEWIKRVLEKLDLILYSNKNGVLNIKHSSNGFNLLFDTNLEKNQISTGYYRSKIKAEFLKVYDEFIEQVKNQMGFEVEYQLRSNLGIEKSITQFALPFVDKMHEESIIGFIQNKTREKSLLAKLERVEENFETTVEITNHFFFMLDNNGHFNFINEVGAVTLGYLKKELMGKHFFEFIDDESKADVALVFQQILETDNRVFFNIKIVDRFLNKIDFEFTAKSIKENGKVLGMIGIGEDITNKVKSENKIKELNTKLLELNRLISIEKDRAKHQITVLEELNRLKNDFISNVSHELRTPLASIVGFAETIVSDKELPVEMIYEFSAIILEEGKRLAKLINDILDFSKLEGGNETINKQKFDLVKVVLDLIESYSKIAETNGLKINKQIPDAEIIINGDKERVTKVFANLLSNGIKFTKTGGLVTVVIQDFLKEVEVIVSDTGIGIAKEDLPKVFQKFSKINRPGLQLPGAGLGLSVVKQIVELHKGLIRIESELNKGTSIIIRLPKE